MLNNKPLLRSNHVALKDIYSELLKVVDEIEATFEFIIIKNEQAVFKKSNETQCSELCINNLNQLSSMLKGVKKYELAYFVDEILALYLAELSYNEVNNDDASAVRHVLFIAINAFPAILDLECSSTNINRKIYTYLPIINQLREQRKVSQIFSVETMVVKNNQALNSNSAATIRTRIFECLQQYELTVSMLKTNVLEITVIDDLRNVFLELEIVCKDFRIGSLWGVCAGLVDALPVARQKYDILVFNSLCSFAAIIRQVGENAEQIMSQPIPNKLLYSLLSLIKESNNYSQRLDIIKQYYNLGPLTSELNQVSHEELQLNYTKRQASKKCLGLILDNLCELSMLINTGEVHKAEPNEVLILLSNRVKLIIHVLNSLDFQELAEPFLPYLQLSLSGLNDEELAADINTDSLFNLAQIIYQTDVTISHELSQLNLGVNSLSLLIGKQALWYGAKQKLLTEVVEMFNTIISEINNDANTSSINNTARWLQVKELLGKSKSCLSLVHLEIVAERVGFAQRDVEKFIASSNANTENDIDNFVISIIKLQDTLKNTLLNVNSEQEKADEMISNSGLDISLDTTSVEPNLHNIFILEAQHLLEKLQANLLVWRNSPLCSNDMINGFLGLLHTLKGSASLAGQNELSLEAHNIESFLLKSKEVLSQLDTNDLDISNHYRDKFKLSIHDIYNQLEHSLTCLQSQVMHLAEKFSDNNPLLANNKACQFDGVTTQPKTTEYDDSQGQDRFVSFSDIVPRLQRLSTHVASGLNKKVTLVFTNPQVKIDRNILQGIISPLEHLIRNAIDHGIEIPQQRLNQDKLETGEIHISLSWRNLHLTLEMTDDGTGIDLVVIKRLAVAKRLVSRWSKLSAKKAYKLLLTPGFSTAKKLSTVSGRGIGMDVVSKEVSKMGGTLDISSRSGVGFKVSISLPHSMPLKGQLRGEFSSDSHSEQPQAIESGVIDSTAYLNSSLRN